MKYESKRQPPAKQNVPQNINASFFPSPAIYSKEPNPLKPDNQQANMQYPIFKDSVVQDPHENEIKPQDMVIYQMETPSQEEQSTFLSDQQPAKQGIQAGLAITWIPVAESKIIAKPLENSVIVVTEQEGIKKSIVAPVTKKDDDEEGEEKNQLMIFQKGDMILLNEKLFLDDMKLNQMKCINVRISIGEKVVFGYESELNNISQAEQLLIKKDFISLLIEKLQITPEQVENIDFICCADKVQFELSNSIWLHYISGAIIAKYFIQDPKKFNVKVSKGKYQIELNVKGEVIVEETSDDKETFCAIF